MFALQPSASVHIEIERSCLLIRKDKSREEEREMLYFPVIMTFSMCLLWFPFYQNIIAAEFIVEEEAGITNNYVSGNYIKACCGGVSTDIPYYIKNLKKYTYLHFS